MLIKKKIKAKNDAGLNFLYRNTAVSLCATDVFHHKINK